MSCHRRGLPVGPLFGLVFRVFMLVIMSMVGAMPMPAAAAEKPAREWLSVWSSANNQYSGGGWVRISAGRLLNPADPGDPAAPSAHVTATYYQSRCWETVAAQESQTILPGRFGSFSTLLAAYPDTLSGQGCLVVSSDVPIAPVNAQRSETGWTLGNGESWQLATEIDLLNGKKSAMQWVSYWEHSVPLGGEQFGGVFTGGYVLNPARQSNRAETLPPASVTVTFYVGACGLGSLSRQDSFSLAPGQFASFVSALPAGQHVGQGCVSVSSDQPVVPLNGSIRTIEYNPQTGQQSQSEVRTTFQQVTWNPPTSP